MPQVPQSHPSWPRMPIPMPGFEVPLTRCREQGAAVPSCAPNRYDKNIGAHAKKNIIFLWTTSF
eukprot:scaffold82699_cov29-Prasinocladus_malaysianus.AAC.1